MSWFRKLLGTGDDAQEAVPVSDVHLRTLKDRAQVAQMSTQELLREWHDWERVKSYAPVTEDGRVRMELVRSELSVRGSDPTTKRERIFEERASESVVVELTKEEVPAVEVAEHVLLDDDLPEWHILIEELASALPDLGEEAPARWASQVQAEHRRSKKERQP